MSFIEVSHLHKRFQDHVVIEDLSVSVEKGEVVIFQGPSGVGKSTFLRCLTLLEPFQKGTIRVGDVVLKAGMDELHDRRIIRPLRRELGFVFQSFHLFPHLSVLDNVTLGPRRVLEVPEGVARKEGLALLEQVGLTSKAGAFPRMLSGGQQQRVGIARALAMKPEAILFDEPTSSLDPAMKAEIVDVMADLKGMTLLIVTHEPAVMQRLPHRVVNFGLGCTIA